MHWLKELVGGKKDVINNKIARYLRDIEPQSKLSK